MKAFITGTGTGVGKTWFTSRLTRHLVHAGHRVAAIKPIETGCDPDPLDALELAEACGRPELANHPGFHRGRLPRAPLSATIAGDPPPPDLPHLTAACGVATLDADVVLVEGAGGLLVPYDPNHDLADLAISLGYPVIVVAPNRLGSLSNLFLTAEALERRSLRLAAIALTEPTSVPDVAADHHVQVLTERLHVPVVAFLHNADSTDRAFHRFQDALRNPYL